MARYGIWGFVTEGEKPGGRLCVLHKIEERDGYAFFQRIADAISAGYGESMGANFNGDWSSTGPDLVYTIDSTDDGSGAQAFALVQPKGGGLKLTFLMAREGSTNQGFGFLLLKWTVFHCLNDSDKVYLENSVTPKEKGDHIYGSKMRTYFDVKQKGDFYYYSKGALHAAETRWLPDKK
jgi:hypothetical protein